MDALFDVVHPFKQSVPADAAQSFAVRIGAPPHKDRFAYDVVFRHKSPIAGVGGVMAVIAHHPIVIHFKGIAGGQFSVDVNLTMFHL